MTRLASEVKIAQQTRQKAQAFTAQRCIQILECACISGHNMYWYQVLDRDQIVHLACVSEGYTNHGLNSHLGYG